MTIYKQTAIDSSSTTPEVRRLRRKARTLAESGRVAEALGYQRALADLTPNDFEALMQLGFMHREVYEIDAAVHAFRRASGVAPHTPDPHEALAELYLDASMYDEAIAESKALLRLMPHSMAAREILSTAYFQKGDIGKALETTSEMVRLAPSDALIHYRRGILFQQRGDWRNALHEFSRAEAMTEEGTVEQEEAQLAIDALDQHQIRQILMVAAEDLLLQMQLARDPEEASHDRGYFLSPNAAAFVGQVANERLSETQGSFRDASIGGLSRRPSLYN